MGKLLEEAKKVKKSRWGSKMATDDEIELAIAYIKGDISYTQYGTVSKKKGSNVYNRIVSALLIAYRQGKLKISQK